MDAIKGNLSSIVNGSKQFIIPIFQRKYNWEIKHCERLFQDIINMQTENKTAHFVGSIVNIAEQSTPVIQKFMIIDGQQRLTTLTLLLLALRDYSVAHPEDISINAQQIEFMYLKNIGFENDRENQFKLILTNSDKEILLKLIDKIPVDDEQNSRLMVNYNYFVKCIKENRISPSLLLDGIAKLQIVNITLDRGVDDAQLIFESLNSTGMDLAQSDLIRNYILMGLEKTLQEKIYSHYWLPVENLFSYDKTSNLMDQFFRDYLTMKTTIIPKFDRIYEAFKQYHQKENNVDVDIEDFTKDIYNFARIYSNIYFCKSADEEINNIYKNLKELQIEVIYPFLLYVSNDYENDVINREEFITILKLCESYILRRAICGIPTNSLNKTFSTMSTKINKNNYLKSIMAYFCMLDTYKVFPNNIAFAEEFVTKDIYNMRMRNYILRKLENYKNKVVVNIDALTIEHIMPQNSNLPVYWREELGENWKEIQEKYLHTIGNLTLTAYNSEMSDRSFQEKLNISGGFKESALRLNKYVVKQDHWREENIKERASELCDIACQIWEYPELTREEIAEFSDYESAEVNYYNLDSYEYLQSDNLELFNELDKRIMNISSGIKRYYTKLYISYKLDTSFVYVIPQRTNLKINLKINYNDVVDPKNLCRDVSNVGKWGNGDTELCINNKQEIDDVMDIIIQTYDKHVELT